jgi:mRNA interferase MazF
MVLQRGHLYIVDFNPPIRTKPGKMRPALVLQSDLVNQAGYPSTVVIPATTRLIEEAGILRLRLPKGEGGLDQESDLLLGQIIAVANSSFHREIGALAPRLMEEVEQRLRIILNL